MSFRTYVRSVEAAARDLGVQVSMTKLRDAISRACYNKPYAAAVAAEKAGKLPNLTLPPAYLESAAETSAIPAHVLKAAFGQARLETTPLDDEHVVLAARSLSDAMRATDHPGLKRLRPYITSLPTQQREAVLMGLGTVAGMASLMARFTPSLLERDALHVAVFCDEIACIVDRGRILQLILAFLKSAPAFRFDVVRESTGPELVPFGPDTNTPWGHYLAQEAAATFFESVEAYDIATQKPDVVFALYPDWVDRFQDIRRSTWLEEAMDAGLPVLGMGYDLLQADQVDLAMRGHGLGHVEIADSLVHHVQPGPYGSANFFGRALWHVAPGEQDRGLIIDGGYRSAFEQVAGAVRRSLQEEADMRFLGEIVRQDGHVLAGGGRARLVDIATGRLYTVHEVRKNGVMLSGRQRTPVFTEEWVPVDEAAVARPYQRVLLVENAFAENLFPNRDAIKALDPEFEDIFGSGMDEDSFDQIFDTLFGQEMEDELGSDAMANARAVLKASMTGESGVTAGIPLFTAASENDANAIRELHRAGHKLEQRDDEGWTPLTEAARVNAHDAARVLLELGADPNNPTLMNHPALLIALTRGHDATAFELLQAGANLDQANAGGVTARSLFEQGVVASPKLLAWYKANG